MRVSHTLASSPPRRRRRRRRRQPTAPAPAPQNPAPAAARSTRHKPPQPEKHAEEEEAEEEAEEEEETKTALDRSSSRRTTAATAAAAGGGGGAKAASTSTSSSSPLSLFLLHQTVPFSLRSGSGSGGSGGGGGGGGGGSGSGGAATAHAGQTDAPDDHDDRVVDDDNSVLVAATAVVFQRELATDHPYIDLQLRARHIFTPLYTSPFELLDELNTLLRITSLSSARARDARLRDLVQQREARVAFDVTHLQHGVVQEPALLDAAASAVLPMATDPGRFRITSQNLYFMPIHAESARGLARIPVPAILSLRRLRHGCRDAALELAYTPVDAPEAVATASSASNGGPHAHAAATNSAVTATATGATGPAAVAASPTSKRKASTTPLSPAPLKTDAAPPPRETLMLSFPSHAVRERAFATLRSIAPPHVELFGRSELEAALARWRAGALSNFDYLMYLNLAAGRSFNDLSQYPVFPWVLADYTSPTLDLSDASAFRDLRLPIGAIDRNRLEAFEMRFREMPAPRFYYGTHYSAPAYVINYLVRAAPGAMLRLQKGRFDTPDRLFNSVASTWRGVCSSQGDVKELIPEFFALDFSAGTSSGIVPRSSSPGEFLDNVLGLDLGVRQDGKRVDDVELPPWANGSSELYVRRHRAALESDHVSARLHAWIDLIFGVKARSAEHQNLFYTDAALPHSLGPEDERKISLEEMKQIETVYLEFGRTPEQLFAHPHPPRFGDGWLDPDEQDVNVNESEKGSQFAHATKPGANSQASPSSTFETVVDDLGTGLGALDVSNENDSPAESGENGNKSLTEPTLKNMWGSRSRRVDSVLAGARDTVLSTFEPPGSSTSSDRARATQAVPPSAVSSVVAPEMRRRVLDMCVIDDGPDVSAPPVLDAVAAEDCPVVCTVTDDGYLRVHGMTRTLRSKQVGVGAGGARGGGLSSPVSAVAAVAYVGGGLVAYATQSGALGLYHIGSARAPELKASAHEAGVSALAATRRPRVVVSGSVDASVRVWLVGGSARNPGLSGVADLDAEAEVDDVAVSGEPGGGDGVLVAAATADGAVVAWRICVEDDARAGGSGEFVPPIWRGDATVASPSPGTSPRWGGAVDGQYGRARVAAWLYQGARRRPVVGGAVGGGRYVRIWSVDGDGSAAGEVYLGDGGAVCVSGCDESRSVLVGGDGGRVTEFDSTGLCLGSVVVAPTTRTTARSDSTVVHVAAASDGRCLYVRFACGEVVRVER